MSQRRKKKGSCLARTFRFIFVLAIFGCLSVILINRWNSPRTAYQPAPPAAVPEKPRHKEKPSVAPPPTPAAETPAKPEKPVAAPVPEATENPNEEPAPVVTPKPAAPVKPASPAHYPVPLGNELSRGNPNSRMIALTFDAGADASPTPEILDALAKHGVHATFFLTGVWAKKNPALVRRIAAEGHEIGNHTWDHKRLTQLTDGKISEEAAKTDALVRQLTGKDTKPLLRAPFGARDEHVLSVLRDDGYRSIYWDIDSWDSVKVGITSEEIEKRVLSKARNGSVILMHCGSKATADALDSMLDKLMGSGYKPVTISTLLQD